jgi:syntaxin 16
MKIAASIQELSEIMQRLATIVIDQGTILDRIDYNMDLAVEAVRGP